MSELNLKQITDKLNTEFAKEGRRLVFWYDDNAEFAEDIDSMELENAKVLHLEQDNQFYVKYFLEREDTTSNYLVYAPFAKPSIRENHLADTIRYSKEFFADRASLITLDLGIDERYKPVIQHYIKFFASKERSQRFYDLEIENFNRSTIEVALMSVLCKNKTSSIEEVLRAILVDKQSFLKNTCEKELSENSEVSSDNVPQENHILAEFEKFDLLNAFWEQIKLAFGYDDPNPTLEKLVITMLVTYVSKSVHAEMPQAWRPFVSYKSGSIIAFMDNMMNSLLYSERYDEISEYIYKAINAKEQFAKMDVEAIADCNAFAGVDEFLTDWIIERLENEDVGAKLNGKSIPKICAERRKKHFGKLFRRDYFVLQNAYHIITDGKFQPISGIRNLVREYTESAFKIDRYYRYFYFYFDKLDDTSKYEKIRLTVENIYTNDFLNQITVNWNNEFADADCETGLEKQRDFFAKNVSYSKDRVVVIISDAFRYEVAYTLFEKMQVDEKCSASITAMQCVIPSYTPLGMAALLPHKKLEYSDTYDVLADGKPCATTEQRESLLRSYKENSRCVQFDYLKNMMRNDLRDIFTGQDVVYIYHNQIDARGDKAASENEVFNACEEAIKEIFDFIKRVASQANTYHFIVTADHGFIYKRDKIKSSDKISGAALEARHFGQRYCISDKGISADGVCQTTVGKILNSDDSRVISFPLGSDIFKVGGAGQNYVHGGCSPQEMLIPLVDVKVEKGKKETNPAEIALVSLTSKITNLITSLDFVQTEPVCDVVKEASYRVYFISDSNEKISNENIIIADKKDKDSAKRMFRLRFNFKNKQYNKTQKYYLVAYDDKNNVEVLRREMIMDITFADDFGF